MTAAVGKGHQDVVPRPPANGQPTVYCCSRKGTVESCPHPIGMSRRAFQGSYVVQKVWWRKLERRHGDGRTTTTTTSANLRQARVCVFLSRWYTMICGESSLHIWRKTLAAVSRLAMLLHRQIYHRSLGRRSHPRAAPAMRSMRSMRGDQKV